jgi:hypothetical protein
VDLAFDICQGIGLAAAVGIRPFTPVLAAGALAAGDVELDFAHTHYAFLQSAPFVLGMIVGAIILAILERRLPAGRARKVGGGLELGPLAMIVVVISLALGALLFAGELCRAHALVWPGYVAGPVCALIAAAASRPLFARVRARLDAEAAKALPLYAEGTAILLAVLSVVAFPVGPIALALLIWLLIAGRRRGETKYAGLRILK